MNLDQHLRADEHNEESSTPREAHEVNVVTDATQEQAAVLPPKRGKKGKYQGQTGPRSKRGKEQSSKNAKMIHGLRAKKLLLPFEDPLEYEAHMQRVMRILNPQDVIEIDIAHAYGYAVWTSPRSEVYRQSVAHQYIEQIDPSKIAKKLGFSGMHCLKAPAFLKDLNHVIAPERIMLAQLIVSQYDDLRKGLPKENFESMDWGKAVQLYPELFSELAKWIAKEGYSPPFFNEEDGQIQAEWLNDHKCILENLRNLARFLDFEIIFMDRKPEIRAYVEQLFWQSHHLVAQGIGCGDHFVKVQNLTFTQLERLLMYRKMKRTLANKEEEVEEG